MSRHERYLSRAAQEASASEHPRWLLGAVLVRGGSVVAVAHNVRRNSPHLTQGAPGTSLHAEQAVINKVFYQADRAEGTTLYVVRVSKTGQRRLARPCHRCYTAVVEAGIKTVVYSLDEPGFGIERIYTRA
jgi:tRNA(Arg) A34 adenosine deaminase TadA